MSVDEDSRCECWAEQQLIDIIKNSELSSFDVLVKYRFNKLYRIAYYILGSHCQAKALADDVLFKAYKNPAGFNGESLFLTWMCQQVIRRACDLRKQRGQDADDTPDAPLSDENADMNKID